MNEGSVDFRDVSAALHGAVVGDHHYDVGRSTFDLSTTRTGGATMKLRFDGLSTFRAWGGAASQGSVALLIVGLERLAPGEPWRLYVKTSNGNELELACRAIVSDGDDVSGIGRSYRV